MCRHLISLSLIQLLVSICVAEPVEIRPLPPGWVYPVLPEAYEGMTLSELGPIKSIELIDRKTQPLAKPSPLSNDTIRKLVFEHRLAHPRSFPMLEAETDKILVVTFADGTRFEYFHSTLQSIIPPNGSPIKCMLLMEANYKSDRIPVSVQPKGEQAGADQPATRPSVEPTVKDQPSIPASKDALR